MDVTTLLVFFLIFILCMMYNNTRRPSGLPPGPAALPFIGNLNLVHRSKTFHRTLDTLAKQYGGIFSLQMGYQSVIVISEFDIMREALVKKARYFSDRPIHLMLIRRVFRGKGLVFQNGEKWEKVRRMVWMNMRNFGVGKARMEARIQEECEFLMEEIDKMRKNPFNPKNIFEKFVCNVIGHVLYGKRFDYSNIEFNKFLDDLTILFGNGVFQNFAFLDILALVGVTLLQPSILNMPMSTFQTREFIRRRIQEHKKTYTPGKIRDFIDVYLDAFDKNETPFDGNTVFQSIMDVFFAGTETTSTSMAWSCYFFIKYPEVQEKCRQEIHRVVGQSRAPAMNDREHLPYLEATMREMLRIGSPTPMGGLHCTAETTELCGYVIPKDTVVITNLYSLHRDPKVWPKPEVMNPERFLNEEGMLVNVDKNMPFGIGKRKCIGDNLARMELFLVISNLLQKYRFRAKNGHEIPSVDKASMGVTLVPPYYEMIVDKIN